MALETENVEDLEELLARHEHLSHLRVKKRGDSLTLFSGEQHDLHLHARLTHIGGNHWGLSLPRHNGRWERTPFTGTMRQLIDTLTSDFGFYLERLESQTRQNPSGT